MKRLFWLSAAALIIAGCSETSTGPASARRNAPRRLNDEELTCKSGYIVAFDENGEPHCVPQNGGDSSSFAPMGVSTSGARPKKQRPDSTSQF